MICDELFTESLRSRFAGTPAGSCEEFHDDLEGVQNQIDISTIEVSGDTATVVAEEGDELVEFGMVLLGGGWRIDDLRTP